MMDHLHKNGMPQRRCGIPFLAPHVFLALAVATLLGGFAVGAHAQLKFYSMETERMRVVYYDQNHRYVIPYITSCFENSLEYYEDKFDYWPTEEVTILFQDFDDYGYAGTSTIPNNYITLGIEPFEYVYETCPTNERFNWVISHELMHVVASEKGAGMDLFWRKFFGGKVAPDAQNPGSIFYSYLSNPRRYAPRWYHEGIAVFMETWMAGGIGRAQGGYDETVFRTMVRDDAYFYDVIGLESEGTTSDFQVGQNSYLYGTRFMSYVALKYGPEKLMNWVIRSDSSKAYYQSQFKRVYGVSLADEWREWIKFEHEWQRKNLATIREYPVTRQRRLTDRAMGSASRGYYDPDTRKFYTAVNYPAVSAHLVEIDIDTGERRKLGDVQTPGLYYVTSLAYDPAAKKLYYTTNNGKHWRDLHEVDVRTGKHRALLANNRTGDLVFNRSDGTIWGVQHHNGISSLVRFLPPYETWDDVEVLLEAPFGRDIFDIDISPDGKWLTAAMFEIEGYSRLVRVSIPDLLAGDAGYDVLWQFPKTAPANFVFAPDGKSLYGTSYQTGVSNVFRFNFESGQMEGVTNVETGYFRPVPIPNDSVIAFNYTKDGLWPVAFADTTTDDIMAVRYLGNEVFKKWPELKDWKLGSPREVNLDSVVTYDGEYHKFRSVKIDSWYPVVEGYKNTAFVGMRLNFMDPLGMHGGHLVLGVSPWDNLPDDEIFHTRFNYRHYPWTFEASYNRGNFYDIFGPRRTSRKGYAVSLDRHDFLISDRPRSLEYRLYGAWFGGLDETPFFQDVPSSYDNYATVFGELTYKNLRGTIGAVDREKGYEWNFGASTDFVKAETYLKLVGKLDIGVPTGIIDHSSLWLRTAGGYSFGEAENTFANFFFGGFQNNYVDHLAVKRYRTYWAFPGIEISEVGGTRFGKAMLEWTLPPWRFEKVGIPNLYTTWMRTALFVSTLGTNFGVYDTAREKLVNAGIQVDFKLVMFSGLPSTLSFGFASATGDGRQPSNEFMVSLKIL